MAACRCWSIIKMLVELWSSYLKLEVFISTDDKVRDGFKSEICEATFAQKSKVNRHIKSVHKGLDYLMAKARIPT